MRYLVRTTEELGGQFKFFGVNDEMFAIGLEPIEMSIEQLGVIGLSKKRLICTPIIEGAPVAANYEDEPTAPVEENHKRTTRRMR